MALYHVFSEVENRNTGVPMSGVQVRARFSGSSTIAPIYANDNGGAFTPENYCVTDVDGMYSFYINSGEYDLDFLVGSQVIKTVEKYRPAEVGPTGPANSTYETTPALELSPVSNVSAILSEAGKAGTFTIRQYADFTAEVAADVGKVNYIRSTSDTSKVWVRTTILSGGAGQTGASSGLTVDAELAAKATLSGVARTATNLGGFTGVTIPDNSSTKAALQSLETAVEATAGGAANKSNATAIGISSSANDMGVFSGATIPDGSTTKAALQALETATEAASSSASVKSNATAIGITASDTNMGSYASPSVTDGQSVKQNVEQLGGRFDAVYNQLRYYESDLYEVNLGNDPLTSTTAVVRIGANDAFRGRGALMIGGAGPKDGGNGSYLANDGHPNWNVIQSATPFNPTEWNIYGNGVGGVAVSTGTTTITRSTGNEWGSFMVGNTLWFNGIAYQVISATASSAVLNNAPAAATATWHYVYTTGTGTCTVAGGVVTRVTGDPFIPHTFTSDIFYFTLNGTPYTVTVSTDSDTCTISSPPANGTYTYSYRTNINNQVASLRIQLTAGASEENLTHFAAPYAYVSGSQFSGSGQYKNWQITSEGQAVVELASYGKFVSLGGVQNAEALRAQWLLNAVNRVDVVGGTAGVSPSFRGRGTDTNVGLAFDTKGTGSTQFTSGSFGAVEFSVFAGGGTSWLSVASNSSDAPVMAANGASANIDIALAPKGTGRVRLGAWTSNADAAVNGYITVKDSSGNVRKLATIA